MKWVYPPISFDTVADETGFDGILSGFRKKLVSPETTDALQPVRGTGGLFAAVPR